MRRPLPNGSIIELSKSRHTTESPRTFCIADKAGSGGSCIVYNAVFLDNLGAKHNVRIKECYPYKEAIQREGNGMLVWRDNSRREQAISDFEAVHCKHLELQSHIEKVNSAAHIIDDMYYGNGTSYIVMDADNGCSYDYISDESLNDIFKTAQALTSAISTYHRSGYLCLDIKPQNFLVIPETKEIVKLFDFDSVILKNDSGVTNSPISYTSEYAAPEVKQNKASQISEASDIFSIAAIVFERIMGRRPSADDCDIFASWGFDENELFENTNPKLKKLVSQLFKEALNASPAHRLRHTDDLSKLLAELVYESDSANKYLLHTCPLPANFFIGRESELESIERHFSEGKKAVFVSGIGGIGKTEIALNYAHKYSSEYNVVLFGQLDYDLASLLTDGEFVSIANEREYENDANRIIKRLRALADRNTLIIIDNFDCEGDPLLEKLLSVDACFIITTRRDFSQTFESACPYAYLQINELPQHRQEELFYHYYTKPVSDGERTVISDILSEIFGFSLLIPIIAKQLENGIQAPVDVLSTLRSVGISGLDAEKVRHRKDGFAHETAHGHFKAVFNMAKLTEAQRDVLSSLCLLGGVRVGKKQFAEWTAQKNANDINSLIDGGWISCDKTRDRLSLHPMIRQIACDELSPHLDTSPGIRDYIINTSLSIGRRALSYNSDRYGFEEPNKLSVFEIRSMFLLVRSVCSAIRILNKEDYETLFIVIYNISFITTDSSDETKHNAMLLAGMINSDLFAECSANGRFLAYVAMQTLMLSPCVFRLGNGSFSSLSAWECSIKAAKIVGGLSPEDYFRIVYPYLSAMYLSRSRNSAYTNYLYVPCEDIRYWWENALGSVERDDYINYEVPFRKEDDYNDLSSSEMCDEDDEDIFNDDDFLHLDDLPIADKYFDLDDCLDSGYLLERDFEEFERFSEGAVSGGSDYDADEYNWDYDLSILSDESYDLYEDPLHNFRGDEPVVKYHNARLKAEALKTGLPKLGLDENFDRKDRLICLWDEFHTCYQRDGSELSGPGNLVNQIIADYSITAEELKEVFNSAVTFGDNKWNKGVLWLHADTNLTPLCEDDLIMNLFIIDCIEALYRLYGDKYRDYYDVKAVVAKHLIQQKLGNINPTEADIDDVFEVYETIPATYRDDYYFDYHPIEIKDYLASLPGAIFLLKHYREDDYRLAVFFINKLTDMVVEAYSDIEGKGNGMYEYYRVIVDYAENLQMPETVKEYEQKISDLTNIHFEQQS